MIFDPNQPISMTVWQAIKQVEVELDAVSGGANKPSLDVLRMWAEWLTESKTSVETIQQATKEWTSNYQRWPVFNEFERVCELVDNGGQLHGPIPSNLDNYAVELIGFALNSGIPRHLWENVFGTAYAAVYCGDYATSTVPHDYLILEAKGRTGMYIDHVKEMMVFARRNQGAFCQVLRELEEGK